MLGRQGAVQGSGAACAASGMRKSARGVRAGAWARDVERTRQLRPHADAKRGKMSSLTIIVRDVADPERVGELLPWSSQPARRRQATSRRSVSDDEVDARAGLWICASWLVLVLCVMH